MRHAVFFRALSLTLTLVLLLSLPLWAFAQEEEEESAALDWDDLDTDLSVYQQFQGQNLSINVYNWGEYISDGGDGSMDVNKEFERLTGIKVNYLLFASNEELYAKLKNGGSNYDVIIPSDYMINRLMGEGLLQELDVSNIPNLKNMDPQYMGLEYDPEGAYSVPYTWGVVGIIYNTQMVDPADDMESWDILWNEKYLGDILMFSNSRDAIGIALKKLGYSYNTTSSEELEEAGELLKEQKPLVQAYVMDEIFDKMGGGEAAMAPYYAGDAVVMMEDNPDLAFAIPKEGTNLFVDAMCIPACAKEKAAAELYINFLCETQVGLANFDYIGYATPLSTVYEALDPEITSNPIQFPPAEVVDKAEVYQNLSHKENQLMDSTWTSVLSADAGDNKWFIPIFMVVTVALSIGINVGRRLRKKRNSY